MVVVLLAKRRAFLCGVRKLNAKKNVLGQKTKTTKRTTTTKEKQKRDLTTSSSSSSSSSSR